MKSQLYHILVLVLMLPIMPLMGVGALQQLMGNIGGLGGNAGKNTVKAQQGYRTDIGIEDGDEAYNTEAEVYGAIGAVGIWTIIFEMTIPAQQAVHWGYGSPATPQNQGYMWFAVVGASAFEKGKLRLWQNSARRTKYRPVTEVSDVALHKATFDAAIENVALINKNEMYALPEKVEFPLVGEDSLIGLEYKMITDATPAKAGFKIPITVYQ